MRLTGSLFSGDLSISLGQNCLDLRHFTASLDQALDVAKGDALRRFVTEIAVIGGAEIYAQCMGQADRLEVTEVHANPAGDARFAAIDKAVWEEVVRSENPPGPDDSVAFSFVTYRRGINAAGGINRTS